MKTTIKTSCVYAALFTGLALPTACSDDEKNPTGGTGSLIVQLDANPSLTGVTKTEIETDPNAPEKGDFTFNISGSDYDKDFSFGEIDGQSIELKEGTYVIKAISGDATKEGFVGESGYEKPWYQGSETFVIEAEKPTEVGLKATLQNAKVSVSYTEKFEAYFADYTWDVTLQANNGDIFRFEMDEEYEPLYLIPGTLKIKIEVSDGSGIIEGSSIEQSFTIAAAKHYKLKFDTDAEMNGEASFNITFLAPEEKEIEITLYPSPILTASEAFENGQLILSQGESSEKRALVSIAGKGEITSCELIINAGEPIDLLDSGADLKGLEFTISDSKTLASLDFTTLISELEEGTYTYTITVQNKNGISEELTVIIEINE